MLQLLAIHALPVLTAATAAGNAVLTAWAFVAHRRRQVALGRTFWMLLLLVLVVLAGQVVTGALVAVSGARPRTQLHYLYGALVTTGAVVQFGLRPQGFLRVAMPKVKTALRAKDARLAREQEFATVFTDCEVGAMPPFANLYQVPVVVERALTEDPTIVFNAGSHRETMTVTAADFTRLVSPTVAEFSAPRWPQGVELGYPSR